MRYLPLTSADRADMLGVIGAASIDDLFVDVPASARLAKPVDLPFHAGELEVERALSRLAGQNRAAGSGPFFCGAGAYRHHVPASVDHLIQRSEFLTSYTPYQPEIAQGTLQYAVRVPDPGGVELTRHTEVANASLYDGSTGCGRSRADGGSALPSRNKARSCRAACIRTMRKRSHTRCRRLFRRDEDAPPVTPVVDEAEDGVIAADR